MKTKLRPALLLALSGLMLSAMGVRATDITVFAAASLTESLKEIGSAYEKKTGDKVVFNLAASSTLARQIEAGAPADIFFSADEAKVDDLDKKGLLVKDSRKSLLGNSLVIIVARESGAAVKTPADLASPNIKHIALGDPKGVPIGIYARQYLQGLGLWEKIEPKVVATESVRAALAAVESGNADASLVYKTDAAVSKKVVVAYEVPEAEGPKISYPMALVKDSKHPEEAKKFYDYLASEDAVKVFRGHGFKTK